MQNTIPADISKVQNITQTNTSIAQNSSSTTAPAQSEHALKEETQTEVTPADSQALWEKALKLFRKEAPGVYSQLLQGRFEGIKGNAAHITFPKEGEINLNMLKLPARLSQMEEIISVAAGRPMKFILELERKTPAPQRKQEDALQKVFDVFGRENVQVVDDPS